MDNNEKLLAMINELTLEVQKKTSPPEVTIPRKIIHPVEPSPVVEIVSPVIEPETIELPPQMNSIEMRNKEIYDECIKDLASFHYNMRRLSFDELNNFSLFLIEKYRRTEKLDDLSDDDQKFYLAIKPFTGRHIIDLKYSDDCKISDNVISFMIGNGDLYYLPKNKKITSFEDKCKALVKSPIYVRHFDKIDEKLFKFILENSNLDRFSIFSYAESYKIDFPKNYTLMVALKN